MGAPSLQLVLISAFCMTLVAEDQQIKAQDSKSLHVLTSFTSEKAKRSEHHQVHRSTKTKPTTSNIVENEASHQSLTTVLPFQKVQPEAIASKITLEIKDEGRSGSPESIHTFRQDQSLRVKTTQSWRTESGPTGRRFKSIDPFKESEPAEGESAISWEKRNGFGEDVILNYGTRGNNFHDFDTTLNAEYNNPKIPVSSSSLKDSVTEPVLSKDKLRPDGDTFPCLPCVCFYRHKKVMANCSENTMYRFPRNLPNETRAIFLLQNHLRSFDLRDLRPYTSLASLSISKNGRLRAITNESQISQKLPVKEIFISWGHIQTVDDRSFKMASNLLKLSLEHNQIRKITNFTFEGLDSLRFLNLSHNMINFIEIGAFDHMKSLTVLDLSKNEHLGYNPIHFSPRLFENLPNVRYFAIDGNSKGELVYPNEVLENFPNLQTLSIDGLDSRAIFQPGMKTLKHFTTLEIGKTAKCYISCVNESFFENIPTVKHISFRSCHHMRLKSKAVPIAKHITSLEIKYCHGYDLFIALDDLHVFQNSSLTSLALIRLIPHSGRLPCRSLRQDQAKHLQFLNLEVLDLSNNFLALVGADFIKLLPKTLKRLILKDNKLGSIGMDLKRLRFLTQLTEVDLSFQNNEYHNDIVRRESRKCPERPGSEMQSENNPGLPDNADYDSVSVFDTSTYEEASVNKKPRQNYCDTYFDYYDETKPRVQDYSSPLSEDFCSGDLMPPNLKIIRAPFYTYFGFHIIGRDQHNMELKEFYLSNNFLIYPSDSSIVPFNVEIADLSNNYCRYLYKTFFRQNNSVTYLSLQNNLLGTEFADDTSGAIFAELGKARYVDIRNNLIYRLPYRFFIGLKSIETLNLGNNKMQALNISLAHMNELRHLDLSRNFISWISKNTMEDLDIIASQHLLTVDLTSNPLPCTCAGLELLYWMSKTNVYFLHQKYLRCRLSNNVLENLGDFKERVEYLQRHCASKAVIIVICISCFVVVAMLMGFSLMYRFRWRLRYLRNIAMAKLVGTPREDKNQNYKFDAYFLFSDESLAFVVRQCLQELEVKRGHKLCINVRNFMPGTFEVSNIVAAVQHSAKTVVVVTPDLYEEDYAEYTIKMALMEEIYNKRSVLHLCVYQPIPDEEMAQCHDLLMVMKRDDYTEYPPENEVREEIMENFWDRLSQAIGHANHDDVDADDND